MATVAKSVSVMEVELGDGVAFWMGDGAYLAVQHDEYGRRHAVLLSAESLAAIASVKRARGRKTVPMRGEGFAAGLEARTALKASGAACRCREGRAGL